MGPLGKACRKCVTDQKQKIVKKVSGVSEWQGLARSNRVYSEWWVLTTDTRVIIIVIHHQIGLDGQPCLHWFPGSSVPVWECLNI
jgi:hypothetical protein